MQRTLVLAALVVSTSAFASDVDPFGFEKQNFDTSVSKTRAQVAAETREAARLGLLRDSLFGPVQASVEQEQQIKLAGLRAIGHSAAVE
jgi:hypothetical protein